MPFGFEERRDIERVVQTVLFNERLSRGGTVFGSGGYTAPACSYIASSTSAIVGSTGSAATPATVKFYSISTGSTLSLLSTGETVYNLTKEYIYANSYFLAQREYGSQNYIVPPNAGSIVLCKTDASHAVDATGTVSIYASTSSDTGHNITATNIYANLDSGAWAHAEKRNGKWYLIAGRC